MMRLKAHWKSDTAPSWASLVLISLCCVLGLCHFFFFKIVSCPIPSCFRTTVTMTMLIAVCVNWSNSRHPHLDPYNRGNNDIFVSKINNGVHTELPGKGLAVNRGELPHSLPSLPFLCFCIPLWYPDLVHVR